jgi:hypothetical protein
MATISTAKEKYKAKIKLAKEQDKYAEGMARFFGVDKDTISGKPPVVNWKKAFETDEKIAAKANAWEVGLKKAFGIS